MSLRLFSAIHLESDKNLQIFPLAYSEIKYYIYIYIYIYMKVDWKVHKLSKILSLNVTKRGLFFNMVLFVVHMLLPMGLQFFDLNGKKDINSRYDIIQWTFLLTLIIIIKLRWQYWVPWLSPTIHPYHTSFLVGLLGCILWPNWADVS